MKKINFLLLLLLITNSIYSQKEYRVIHSRIDRSTSIDEVNKLASEGFKIENCFFEYNNYYKYGCFLMYRNINEGNTPKTYLQINAEDGFGYWIMELFGDLPSDYPSKYGYDEHKDLNDVIKELTERGYQIDKFACSSSTFHLMIIMSKDISTDSSQKMVYNNDVTEKARYNLQGMPIRKNEKGIQIVVYSDYSTKIINQQ